MAMDSIGLIVFYRIYDQIGLAAISKERIKEAFYWADRLLEEDLSIREAGFRPMMERQRALSI